MKLSWHVSIKHLRRFKMLKINLSTGTAWTKSIYVPGDDRQDLMSAIEQYFDKYGCPVAQYQYHELQEDYSEGEISELYVPINGGEYYIDMPTSAVYLGYKVELGNQTMYFD